MLLVYVLKIIDKLLRVTNEIVFFQMKSLIIPLSNDSDSPCESFFRVIFRNVKTTK